MYIFRNNFIFSPCPLITGVGFHILAIPSRTFAIVLANSKGCLFTTALQCFHNVDSSKGGRKKTNKAGGRKTNKRTFWNIPEMLKELFRLSLLSRNKYPNSPISHRVVDALLNFCLSVFYSYPVARLHPKIPSNSSKFDKSRAPNEQGRCPGEPLPDPPASAGLGGGKYEKKKKKELSCWTSARHWSLSSTWGAAGGKKYFPVNLCLLLQPQ